MSLNKIFKLNMKIKILQRKPINISHCANKEEYESTWKPDLLVHSTNKYEIINLLSLEFITHMSKCTAYTIYLIWLIYQLVKQLTDDQPNRLHITYKWLMS